MKTTRRDMLKTAAISMGATVLSGAMAHAAEEGPADASDSAEFMRPLDYGLSFICNTSPVNSVRFWVESRTRVLDDTAGTVTDYWQCGSCKSEFTFAEKDLFMPDNYDFLPILGGGSWLVFRRLPTLSDRYRQVQPFDKMWGEPVMKLKEVPDPVLLETWEEIRDATAAALPIVTQTEIANEETGLRAIIECPCKTMNISIEKQMYQVDTGPVVFPDLTKRYDSQMDCLSLAFIAFNAAHFADFVVEQPVKVGESEEAQTYHYTNPFSLPSVNRVFALGSA